MDKNLKRSLFFGAAVGGLFALGRNLGEKQKLTDGQLKSVNEVQNALAQLHNSLIGHLSLDSVLEDIRALQHHKQYKEAIARAEEEIQIDAHNRGLVRMFKTKLQYVLGGRFTEQRNNVKAHQAQSAFLPFKELPDILWTLLDKRTALFRLMQKGFYYIDAGEATDFKSNDGVLLRTYVSEFNALQKQAEGLVAEFNDESVS